LYSGFKHQFEKLKDLFSALKELHRLLKSEKENSNAKEPNDNGFDICIELCHNRIISLSNPNDATLFSDKSSSDLGQNVLHYILDKLKKEIELIDETTEVSGYYKKGFFVLRVFEKVILRLQTIYLVPYPPYQYVKTELDELFTKEMNEEKSSLPYKHFVMRETTAVPAAPHSTTTAMWQAISRLASMVESVTQVKPHYGI